MRLFEKNCDQGSNAKVSELPTDQAHEDNLIGRERKCPRSASTMSVCENVLSGSDIMPSFQDAWSPAKLTFSVRMFVSFDT